jgi:hypothetical protein
MRLISTIHKASEALTVKTYKDTNWNEYRVKTYIEGQHQIDADYHTDDKEDALDTARAIVARYTATA